MRIEYGHAKGKKIAGIANIQAQVLLDDIGSCRVLEECGFIRTGVKQGAADLYGRRVDLVGFEWVV